MTGGVAIPLSGRSLGNASDGSPVIRSAARPVEWIIADKLRRGIRQIADWSPHVRQLNVHLRSWRINYEV